MDRTLPRRHLAHPLATPAFIAMLALCAVLMQGTADRLLAGLALGMAAGYALSGSV